MFLLLKKIIIWGLIGWALVWFYQKFVGPTLQDFFKANSGKVPFFSVFYMKDTPWSI